MSQIQPLLTVTPGKALAQRPQPPVLILHVQACPATGFLTATPSQSKPCHCSPCPHPSTAFPLKVEENQTVQWLWAPSQSGRPASPPCHSWPSRLHSGQAASTAGPSARRSTCLQQPPADLCSTASFLSLTSQLAWHAVPVAFPELPPSDSGVIAPQESTIPLALFLLKAPLSFQCIKGWLLFLPTSLT